MSATTTGSTAGSTRVELDINGTAADVRAALATTLLTVLRDELHLTAAKRGCNQGVCGACTVEIDGVPMRSCLSLAHGCVERPVRTLEGLLETPRMQALQRAFAASGAFQCGLHARHAGRSACAAAADPAPDEAVIRRALSGNLCRCTGYARIVAAVQEAATALVAASGAAA
jgi:carbon-monoxide dehydrogenase small subunit